MAKEEPRIYTSSSMEIHDFHSDLNDGRYEPSTTFAERSPNR